MCATTTMLRSNIPLGNHVAVSMGLWLVTSPSPSAAGPVGHTNA